MEYTTYTKGLYSATIGVRAVDGGKFQGLVSLARDDGEDTDATLYEVEATSENEERSAQRSARAGAPHSRGNRTVAAACGGVFLIASRRLPAESEAIMPEQVFLCGVYAIHVRPVELQGSRWDAEYGIRHHDKAVQPWTTVGGDDSLVDQAEPIELAHQRAVSDIETGAGIPKPCAFP